MVMKSLIECVIGFAGKFPPVNGSFRLIVTIKQVKSRNFSQFKILFILCLQKSREVWRFRVGK